MRLIDADAFWEQFAYGEKMLEEMARVLPTEVSKAVLEMYKELKERLDASPTIDAVQVIRCKDCKYYKENTLACSRYGLEDDDYCSWAERKES